MEEPKTEERIIDTLLERGVIVKISALSPLRLLRPVRSFRIRPLTLSTLYRISGEIIKMNIDVKKLEQNPVGESFQAFRDNSIISAKIAAIAVLGNRSRYGILVKVMAGYFLAHLSPSKLQEFILTIIKMSNIGDFITSIRLIQRTAATRKSGDPIE